mmetsp:Transcript_11039/g.12760  ORF Transcript_11039/g.12760 Transcript_11039/m.12760 type:complete len:333 (+) Transcript_11039:251-1249(+)|eukprot:CAMPEP_0184014784 /NCGR_PEP_ID=MMETSP0954-20121128/5903_1 /TAXON_ID=627963 /ORGANISM="Aplanochytrium sp, Strain PBS07" /LENGTH=332 /DNA_ID=CAMNT_0026295407 /DNA_START=454 /DNA_END=1452 /DNA_ORIENTATION=-
MKILVVGAGAIGLPLGMLLRRNSQNQITFFVRERRAEYLKEHPQLLYSYDTEELYTFSPDNYDVVSNASCDSLSSIECVFVSLPGSVLGTVAGKHLIGEIANSVSKRAVFVNLSPGLTTYDDAYRPAGVSSTQFITALPIFLSHDVPMPGQPESEKFPERDHAQYGFHMMMSKHRPLMLMGNPLVNTRSIKIVAQALRLADLYPIKVPASILQPMMTATIMLYVLLHQQGYPATLKTNDSDFRMAIRAVGQIFAMHGLFGYFLSWVFGGFAFRWMHYFDTYHAKPIDAESFIKFHHGDKVRKQNVQLLEQYVKLGKKIGKPTIHIEAFISAL